MDTRTCTSMPWTLNKENFHETDFNRKHTRTALRWPCRRNVPTIFDVFKIFSFATGPYSEKGHLRLLSTHTSLGFPSEPISTLGGSRKVVKRKIWGGMYKLIMSARVDGLYNNLLWEGCIMCLSHWFTFSFPERISSGVKYEIRCMWVGSSLDSCTMTTIVCNDHNKLWVKNLFHWK